MILGFKPDFLPLIVAGTKIGATAIDTTPKPTRAYLRVSVGGHSGEQNGYKEKAAGEDADFSKQMNSGVARRHNVSPYS